MHSTPSLSMTHTGYHTLSSTGHPLLMVLTPQHYTVHTAARVVVCTPHHSVLSRCCVVGVVVCHVVVGACQPAAGPAVGHAHPPMRRWKAQALRALGLGPLGPSLR